MSNGSKTISLQLPQPHPAQLKIIQESKRFNACCLGRRAGKTVLGMDRLIHPALAGKPTAWWAPNFRYLSETWRTLLETLRPVTVSKNETERRIELLGGGSVDCFSLDSPDAGRGRAFAVGVIDEAAIVVNLELAWQQNIRATLTDMIGTCWFLSTRKGINNYFHTLFQRGQDPDQPSWASWQMPTSINPAIDPAEIAAARADLSDLAFRQEYEAQFISWEGAVFRKIQEAIVDIPEWLKNPGRPAPWTVSWPTFAISIDWGRTNDYTVFTVLARVPGLPYVLAVEVDRFRGMEYALQRARLAALWSRFGRPFVIGESNSIGGPNIEQLRRDGIPVHGFQTTNATKSRIIQDIALGFEQGTLKIPNHPALIGELQAFRSRTLPSGLVQYSAPDDGGHDDGFEPCDWLPRTHAAGRSVLERPDGPAICRGTAGVRLKVSSLTVPNVFSGWRRRFKWPTGVCER